MDLLENVGECHKCKNLGRLSVMRKRTLKDGTVKRDLWCQGCIRACRWNKRKVRKDFRRITPEFTEEVELVWRRRATEAYRILSEKYRDKYHVERKLI